MEPRLLAATATHYAFDLAEDYPLRLARARGRRIECVCGIVWITAYKEALDVMLRPGEVFIVPNGGLTLVEAIGRCQVTISRPDSLLRTLCGMTALRGWLRRTGALAGLRGLTLLPRWLGSRH